LRALYPAGTVRLALAANRRDPPPPFGLGWMHRYLGHYLTAAPSRFHLDLAADLATVEAARGQRLNYIGPRGSAKTTLISKGKPLHGAVSGTERLTLLLAETAKQSKSYLGAIKRELEGNRALARDYPDAAGRGPVWQTTHIRLRNGCEIMAAGSGGRVLGTTAGERRPTLVVVDDGNERGDAFSPTKRERKLDWLTKDVLPVGEPGTSFVVAGTPIHREALVCHLRAAGWRTRSYSAMSREPDRLDLWRAWERIRLNLADPEREAAARVYYERHRADMDAGAELLWPERETLALYALMEYKALYGEAAYRTEYTDDPGTPEGAEWPAEYFDRPGFWFDDWPAEVALRVIALDPSKGMDATGGDYQAHALLALGRDGTIYVDADLRREPSEAMCRRTVELARGFAPGHRVDAIVLEDNGTMGLLRAAMDVTDGAKMLPWECLTNTGRKDVRIRAVGPYLSRGQVRVRNSPGGRMLVEQWREFPFGANDDGPDAVATGLIRLEQLAGGVKR
jgi:phage terminase large subunit-like protein